jgi:ankyrin repeat protein
MNVNVLKDNPSWAYYIYFSLPLAVAMGVGYALFAKCAGIIERRRRNLRIGVLEAGVVDNAPMWTSNNNIDTVLSWATATGQMGRPAENRDATTHGEWLLGEEHISLTSAIMRGQVEIAKRLIHKPETILNEIDATGKTALHHAVFHGYDDVVEELLAANAAVDVADQQGHTPLDLAVEAVNESCTSLLLRHHYSATIHDNDVTQVDYEVLRHGLHYAAMFVDLKMVDRLLQSGFPSGRRNRLGRTLLFPALQTRDIDFFQRLLDRIIDITCTDNIGYNLLHVAVEMNYVEGVKLLISRGISIDQKAAVTLRTPLFCVNPVSTIASDTILEALIDAGADMNATDNGGNMFVHHLAKSDAACAPAIELLVNKGADLLCENESHDLPHHLAAASGNLSAIMALKLAPKGFDALNKTATDKLRQRPIEIAASRGFLEVVIEIHKLYPDMILNTTPEGLEVQALLIEVAIRNDDLDRLKNILLYTNGDLKDGQEPFHYAILHNAERIMRYMIEIGCKVEWATSPIGPYSSTVFQLAIEKKCGRTVDILLDMNVSLEGTDSYGWTCLHSAAKVGELSIATRIVAAMNKSSYRGVLVTVRDREGWTAFDIALNQDHKALIDLLKDKTYVKGHYLPPWDSRRTKYFPGCPFSVPADVIEPIEIPVSTATSIPPETRRWLAMVAEQSKHMFTTTKKT